jgi:hypothetical protein
MRVGLMGGKQCGLFFSRGKSHHVVKEEPL